MECRKGLLWPLYCRSQMSSELVSKGAIRSTEMKSLPIPAKLPLSFVSGRNTLQIPIVWDRTIWQITSGEAKISNLMVSLPSLRREKQINRKGR
ncbi:hypothetical protein FKM82_020301 [Ascaphus truei]